MTRPGQTGHRLIWTALSSPTVLMWWFWSWFGLFPGWSLPAVGQRPAAGGSGRSARREARTNGLEAPGCWPHTGRGEETGRVEGGAPGGGGSVHCHADVRGLGSQFWDSQEGAPALAAPRLRAVVMGGSGSFLPRHRTGAPPAWMAKTARCPTWRPYDYTVIRVLDAPVKKVWTCGPRRTATRRGSTRCRGRWSWTCGPVEAGGPPCPGRTASAR
jgi:hypothetical protein